MSEAEVDLGKSYLSKDPVIKYTSAISLRLTDVQKRLMETTMQQERYYMMGAPECLQLSANLIQCIGAKKVLDIGGFTGCSALAAALALPKDGEVNVLDISEDFINVGKPFFKEAGVSNKIKIHIAPALDTLQKFVSDGQTGSFDYAFIDADKPNYINYYELCLKLIRSGGIIAVDNTLWGNKVLNASDSTPFTVAIRSFNEHIKGDTRVNVSFLTTGDGFTLLFVK